jgi:hypothetical protein
VAATMVNGVLAPDDNPKSFLGSGRPVDYFWLTLCERCELPSLFYRGLLIYPDAEAGPPPNPDLSDDILAD